MRMFFRNLFLSCSVIGALLASSDVLRADVIAISDNAGVGPLQNFQGSLGAEFTVNAPTTVTQLGAFDNGNIANLAGVYSGTPGVEVGIFNSSGNLLESVMINPTSVGTQIAGDFFVAVTPFTLAPGNYTLVSYNDMNYNNQSTMPVQATYTTSPDVNMNPNNSFVSYESGLTFELPNVKGNFGPAPRYDFASFQFSDPPAAPEPNSSVLMGAGGIGLAIGRYRRRQAIAG